MGQARVVWRRAAVTGIAVILGMGPSSVAAARDVWVDPGGAEARPAESRPGILRLPKKICAGKFSDDDLDHRTPVGRGLG